MKKIKLGINGFGRIGRCVAKIASQNPSFDIVAINDVVTDLRNLIYLFNYDSTYGAPPYRASDSKSPTQFSIGHHQIRAFHEADLADVPWEECGADIVVNASGVAASLPQSQRLIAEKKVSKVIVTHSPKEYVDSIIIMGVNDQAYDANRHHVVASSICDANALAHVLAEFEDKVGIVSGMVTTLHPWLSYQNLVDGPISSQNNPNLYWGDYSLGRSSAGALIPKETTAISAVMQVLPQLKGKIDAISYRVPTGIVASSDVTLQLKEKVSLENVREILEILEARSPYVRLNREPLISHDYRGISESVVIDDQWTRVVGDQMVKLVLWYDNEWGYSNRVVDLAQLMSENGL